MPDLLNYLRGWIEEYLSGVWGATWLIILGLVVAGLVQRAGLKRLQRHYQTLTQGVEGDSLIEILNQHMDKVAQIQGEMQRNSQRIQELGQHESHCIQNIGFFRYDAFEDVGGLQSFAVALLDAHQKGLVINSLVGRQETRIFAKKIGEGTGPQFFSEEEQKAIEAAKRDNYLSEP